jgi:hypothetical protein
VGVLSSALSGLGHLVLSRVRGSVFRSVRSLFGFVGGAGSRHAAKWIERGSTRGCSLALPPSTSDRSRTPVLAASPTFALEHRGNEGAEAGQQVFSELVRVWAVHAVQY